MTNHLEARLDRLEGELSRLSYELAAVRALALSEPVVSVPEAPLTSATPLAPPAYAPPPPAAVPPPLLPPPLPPAPPKPPRRSLGQLAHDWDLVGARGFAIAGGVVLAFGIGLFFVLASNRGWIDDRARVALGGIASALAVGAGWLLRARYGQYWAAVAAVGAGLAGAYATLAAAAARYDLVPDALALPLAALIAGIGTAIAMRWSSQVLAAIGLMGAALAPALQALDTGMTWTSAAFALIVLVATAAVAVPRDWQRLLAAIAVVVGAQVLGLALYVSGSAGEGDIAVATGLVAALLLIGVALQLVQGEGELHEAAASYAIVGFAATMLLTLILFESREDRGIALFVAAAAWAVATGALFAVRQPDLGVVVGIAAFALAGAGTAYLLTDSALAITWAAQSLVLATLAWRFRDARMQVLALVYATLAATRTLTTDGDPRLLLEVDADHLAAVLPLASVALAVVVARIAWPKEHRRRTEAGLLSFITVLREALETHANGLREVLVFAAAAIGTLAAAFAFVAVSFDAGHVAASALAAAVGAVLLANAGRTGSDASAAASFTWLVVVLAEAFAFDTAVLGESDVGSYGGWSLVAAATGLVIGAYALHVFEPGREEWDVVSGIAAGVGLVAYWIALIDLTDSDLARGGGLVAAAAAYVALAGFVFRREGLRTFATTLWAIGLVALIVAERLLLQSDTAFVIALAATGAGVGGLASPLREERLWIAGLATTGLATVTSFAVLTPPSDFFVASEHPGSGLSGLVVCALALGALAGLAVDRRLRVVTLSAAGGVVLYAVSLGILEIAERASTASIETDFERGHTAVSGLWALVGLGLLVVGLLRGSALIRYSGLILFALSLAKIFLFDLAELSSVARAFSFILVGGLLLAGGFFLQRLSDRMAPQDSD